MSSPAMRKMNCCHKFDSRSSWCFVNPELLRSFLAVTRHLSFTRAAEQRALTQPAVSRQVGQLERELGAVLFERLGRAVHLTDAGRALVPLAEELLGQLDRVVETVRAYGDPAHGQLRIGASTTPGYYLLPPILGRYHAEYPGVELRLVVENTLAIEQRLVHNELDIALVGDRPAHTALRSEPVVEDEIVCFCGPKHPLARRRRIAPGDLRDELWVVRERGSATRQLFERRFVRLGGRMGRTTELSSPEGIKALVGAGIGISFMSAYGLQHEVRERRLHRLDVAGLRLTRPILVVRHADKHLAPPIRGFLQLLADLH